jgi:hypothetical protein
MERRNRGALQQWVLVLACMALAAAPHPAAADCLTGTGSVGMETGNQTLAVTLKNFPAAQQNPPAVCGPSLGVVDPGVLGASSGIAEFQTDSLGYSAQAAVTSGSLLNGSCAATVAGSVRFTLRVVSQPGYTGPSTVDLDLAILVGATGSGSASGVNSSFAGTYASDGSIKEAGGLGTSLYHAGGATATATPTLYTPTYSARVDRDHIVTFPLSIQVSALSAFDTGTGTIGSAASAGEVRISWSAHIASGFEDPDLAVEYKMVSALGLDPPETGKPPALPSDPVRVPALQGIFVLLLPITLVVTAMWAARRRAEA